MVLRIYQKHLEASGCSPGTIKWYMGKLYHFADWLDHRPVTTATIEDFLIYLQKAPAQARNPHSKTKDRPICRETLRGYVRAIKTLCRWCYKEGRLKTDLSKSIRMPSAEIKPLELYTKEEFGNILSHISSLRDRALLLLLYDTGMRLSEATGLNAANLDIRGRTAIIKGKGNKSRVVPFGERARLELEAWTLHRNGFPLVFPSRYGGSLTESTVWQMLKDACIRAEVPLRRELIHSIRHTAACNLLEASGGDILYVKEVLGHSSIQTTMIYVRHLESKRILAKAKTFDSPGDRL